MVPSPSYGTAAVRLLRKSHKRATLPCRCGDGSVTLPCLGAFTQDVFCGFLQKSPVVRGVPIDPCGIVGHESSMTRAVAPNVQRRR
jgi:hypothetical protein